MRRHQAKTIARISFCVALAFSSGLFPHSAFAKPYSDGELKSVEAGDEPKIRELRDQEIGQLRIALGRRVPTNRRADLYYRLAELYLEGYHQEYVLEGRVHEKRLEANQADPSIDHSHSKPYLTGGIKACQEILSLGISYPKMDQIYYFLAFNHSELGDHKAGIRYYEELTEKFPESPFVAEAYRELGDEAFGANQFRKAMGYYELALKKATGDVAPRVYHKLAWTYYRTKQFDQAIEALKQAVTLSQQNGEKFLSLHEEALRDMAIFMTEAGRVDEAIAYFHKTVSDKSFYPKLLERLGKQYERNVEPAKATQVYESLLKTNPDSEEAFRVLVKLVDLDLRRGHFKEALGRLEDPHNPRTPRIEDDETRVAAQNLRAMIRRTATEHHEEYRKKNDRAALEIAESYYTAYLDVFLAHDDPRKETQEIEMYLAEVKRELGKSKEASELYRKVVDSRDPRYAKEAGALWTASLSEAIKKSTPEANGANGASKPARPSALEDEYVDAADRLQDALGDTAEGREAALRAAQVQAGYPETRKDALKRIQKIIETAPRTSQALTSARLWVQLQAENPKFDDDDMKELIEKLRANVPLMTADQEMGKGKLRAALNEQETRLKVNAISRNEKDKNYKAAAQGYEAFARESTQRDVAEKAFANAMAGFVRSDDTDSADRVSSEWLKRYPQSARAVESLKGIATQYLIQGKFAVAAQFFERAGMEGGDLPSLETAARVFDGLSEGEDADEHDGARAQADHAKYANALKAGPAKGAALLALARSYEATAAGSASAANVYQECMGISQDFEAECGMRLVELDSRLKKTDESQALLKKIAAIGGKKKSDSLPPDVGLARFKLADAQEQAKAFEPLELPEDRLKRSLSQRLAFMETISRSYQSVVDVGGPWAIAALDRLGRIALSFANEVDKISPPAKISEKGTEQFKKNLAAISGPLRKKAIDTWLEAYKKAVAAESFSPVLPELADRLANVKVSLPARAQGPRPRLKLAGVSSGSGSFSKTRERLLKVPQDASAWLDYGNLLFGQKQVSLAKLCYDRAGQVDAKSAAALNNQAVVLLNAPGATEDWREVAEADSLLQSALRNDKAFRAALANRAMLLGYYRIFQRSKALWDQVFAREGVTESKADLADYNDGFGAALQGLGEADAARVSFKKAEDLDASSGRFVGLYHQAAVAWSHSDPEKCLDELSDIKKDVMSGFEKESADRLKQDCEIMKGKH